MNSLSLLTTCVSGHEIYHRLAKNIQTVVRGQGAAIRKLLAAFFVVLPVLLENGSSTDKTTLAKALKLSVNIDFKQIQFTSLKNG
jgi:MoxR-like ATPase